MKWFSSMLIILISLCFSHVNGQVCGYAGKRILIKTDAAIWAWHGEQNLEIEYATNRRMTLNASLRRYSRSFNQDYRTERENPNSSYNSRGYFSELFPDLTDEIRDGGKLTGNEITLKVKFFYRAGSPAPIGLYTELFGGLAMLRANGITNDDGTNYPTDFTGIPWLTFEPVAYTMKKLPMYNCGLGMGHQSVHFKRYILDFGAMFRFRGAPSWRYYDLASRSFESMTTDFVPRLFSGRTYYTETVEFIPYLKVGILLF